MNRNPVQGSTQRIAPAIRRRGFGQAGHLPSRLADAGFAERRFWIAQRFSILQRSIIGGVMPFPIGRRFIHICNNRPAGANTKPVYNAGSKQGA